MSLSMMIYTSDRGFSLTNYMIFILIIMLILSWIKTRNLSYVTCAAVFGIYLLFLIDEAFFPFHVAGGFADMMRTMPFMSGVNLIPFKFRYSPEFSDIIRELALNVALLIPFGFGISFLVPFKAKSILWLAPAIGSSIEAIQLVISLMIRYPYRVIDTTDVIMNTLGFLIGYIIFRVFVWFYISMTNNLNITHTGLGKYIYTIAKRTTH